MNCGHARFGRPLLKLLVISFATSVFVPANASAASIVLGATGVSTNMGTSQGALVNLINQSGLSASYVSGVTDFATFMATTTSDATMAANGWASTSGNPTGVITFDLGAASLVDGLALWNLANGVTGTLRGFSLFADNDSDFSNGTTTSLGAFVTPNEGPSPLPARTFGFSAVTTRFLQFQITANNGANLTGLTEVAFRGTVTPAAPVPEPASVSLMLVGLAGLVAMRRRRTRHQA